MTKEEIKSIIENIISKWKQIISDEEKNVLMHTGAIKGAEILLEEILKHEEKKES